MVQCHPLERMVESAIMRVSGIEDGLGQNLHERLSTRRALAC